MKKFFINLILLLLLLLLPFTLLTAYAQEKSVDAGAGQRTFVGGTYLGTFQPEAADPDLLPELRVIKNEVNKSQFQDDLHRYKDSLNKIKIAAGIVPTNEGSNKTTQSTTPLQTFGFNAHGNQGTPSDNTLAVGQDGKMIAAVNSSLRVYSTSGSGVGLLRYFQAFWNPVTNKTNMCDPLVYYDPEQDRFIVFTQVCDKVTTDNRILMAFSATNDPSGMYHYYSFRANLREILGVTYQYDVWFDYPKMAVSASDVFVTGNMFRNVNSTQSSFVESIVFQIDKIACFAGDANPTAIIFNNIANGPFTLVPASYGRDGNYGDVMYLAATLNYTSSSTIRMYTITGKVQNSPTISGVAVNVPTYSQPADGVQQGTNVLLNSGDLRAMSAMYLDGTFHLAFHSNGPGNYIGLNYSRLTKNGNTWTAQNKLITVPGVDCAYPAIASMGWNNTDQSVLIVYDYTTLTSFPGMRAVFIDHNMNVSGHVELKSGTGYVDYVTDNGKTRWGDYAGISREHNAVTPTVWGFGMYGNANHQFSNYISKLQTNAWPVATDDVKKNDSKVSLFPNPVIDMFHVQLDIEKAGKFAVVVYDMQGKKVKDVFSRNVTKGPAMFSFNKNGLASGMYFVKIYLDNENISNEKIIVAK